MFTDVFWNVKIEKGCEKEKGRPIMRIYLVRHGETNWNQERRVQGSADIPLSEKDGGGDSGGQGHSCHR